MNNTAEETRLSHRFPTILRGFYFLEDEKGEGKECTIINISHNGAGVEFYTLETVYTKSKLFLEIHPPNGKETVNVEGRIRWVKQGRKDCVCGFQLTEKLDEAQKEILKG